MKLLNGFRKKYFSLSTIIMYSTCIKIHNDLLVYKNHLLSNFKSSSNDEEEESPPSLVEELTSCFIQSSKPCHCDCLFKRKTRLAVLLFKFIPRCPYYCTFFAFRRTGTHPPAF